MRRREAKVARETFGAFWARLPADRRPYVIAGTLQDCATHGTPMAAPDRRRIGRHVNARMHGRDVDASRRG